MFGGRLLLSALLVSRGSVTNVLGYKGKSGRVPRKVSVYSLFRKAPEFFPPAKQATKLVCMGKNTSYFIWVSPDLLIPPSTELLMLEIAVLWPDLMRDVPALQGCTSTRTNYSKDAQAMKMFPHPLSFLPSPLLFQLLSSISPLSSSDSFHQLITINHGFPSPANTNFMSPLNPFHSAA